MQIAEEEIFGPVSAIIRVGELDDAVDMANDVPFGLASSIYTRDLHVAMGFVERTQVGLTQVNLMTALKEPQLSFGGVKASGFGTREAGEAGIAFFTQYTGVHIRYR
jgi:aldehyde dehydrogenase (NAD+)